MTVEIILIEFIILATNMKPILSCITTFIIFIFLTPAGGQNITIKDIRFKEGYHFTSNSLNQMDLIYKIRTKKSTESVFRRIRFDTLLTVKDTTLIELDGDYKLLTSASSTRYTASFFVSQATNRFVIHFIDNLTREQFDFPFMTNIIWDKKLRFDIKPTSNPSTFCLLLETTRDRRWEIMSIGIDGKRKWYKSVSSDNRKIDLSNLTCFSERIFFTKTEKPGKPKLKSELVLLEDSTGNMVYSYPMYDHIKKKSIANIFQLDSTRLLLTGFNYYGKKLKENVPSKLYIGGLSTTDLKYTEAEFKGNALNQSNFFVMGYVNKSPSERFLIGESFRSNTSAEHFFRGFFSGLATLGIAYLNYTKLTFHDIIVLSVDFSAEDQELGIQTIKATHRPVTAAGYLPPPQMARYAYNTGQVRYLHADSNGKFYLQDKGILKKYDPANKNLIELGVIPTGDSQFLIFASDKYLIFYNQRKLYNLIEFKIFPLTKN